MTRSAAVRRTARCGLVLASLTGLGVLTGPGVAWAHEAPAGDEYVLADWMLLAWLLFFACALTVFMVALKRGLLSNLEDGKYHILTIDEPDYYTPDWAREEGEPDARTTPAGGGLSGPADHQA